MLISIMASLSVGRTNEQVNGAAASPAARISDTEQLQPQFSAQCAQPQNPNYSHQLPHLALAAHCHACLPVQHQYLQLAPHLDLEYTHCLTYMSVRGKN